MPADSGKAPRRHRRPAAAIAAFVFFFAPAVAFTLGERAVELENRKLPSFPDLFQGWDVIPEFEAWGIARLPLRDKAIHGNLALSNAVFDEPPAYNTGQEPTYPRVIEGEDGWLYFGDDVLESCRPKGSIEETLARVERLGEIVRSSGRKFVFTVAPDKTTIYPDRLPDKFLGQDCLRQRKQEFWEALRQANPKGYVDLREPLLTLQSQTGEPVYWRTDSHWTDRSSGLYGMTLATTLQPDLAKHTTLTPAGQQPRTGDLGPLMASPREETIDLWKLTRKGVREVAKEDTAYPTWFRIKNKSTKAPLFKPHTVLVGDSFTRNSLPWVTPYFADLTVLRSDAPTKIGPAQVAEVLKSADVVVFEMVERYWLGGHGEMLDEDTLTALQTALGSSPR